jgi:dihydropteroate synthase
LKLRCRDRVLPLDRAAVMGVLNVTPDSFSDGGLWLEPDAAVARGRAMITEGATIVDVGGESTRPGASRVDADEELRRVVPVIEVLAGEHDAVVSIDTRKPAVAERAIEAGAVLVNDTSGEIADPRMDDVVAAAGAAIVIMHSRGTPQTMRTLTAYDDVIDHVRSFLSRRVDDLAARGVAPESIAIDPGIGFAKDAHQSLAILNRLHEIVSLGRPVVVGTSRKSFIGRVLDVPEDERLEGTEATVAWAVAKGARIVRVHDVAPHVRVVRMTEAILHSATG